SMGDCEGGGSSYRIARRLPFGTDGLTEPRGHPADLETAYILSDSTPGQPEKPRIVEERASERRPKVSVMLITYNHEKYIAQALESVLMQETNLDFETNVIEDCSIDMTQDIVMRYVRTHPHIVKPYFNEKNIGFNVTQKNFYRGFPTLTGDYFAILEGDDYWTSPQKLQRQVDFL